MSGINEVINTKIQDIFPGNRLIKSHGLVRVHVNELATNEINKISELTTSAPMVETTIKRSGLDVVVKFHSNASVAATASPAPTQKRFA